MDTLKYYLHACRLLMKSHFQYPASFCMQTLAQLIMCGGEMMAVLFLVDRFDTLNQWSGGDLLVFYGVMSLTFYLTECLGRGITGSFPSLIRTGQLDVFLLRPRGVITQVLCHEVDPRRLGCMAVGVTAMILGCKMNGLRWNVLKVLALLEAIPMGMMLILGLFLIEAMFCIYSVKSVELVNIFTYGGRSACQYPIDIYPRPLRLLFLIIAPFGLTLHAPLSFILDKPLYGWPTGVLFLCPLAGAAFLLLMNLLFRAAMRHYRSTGS